MADFNPRLVDQKISVDLENFKLCVPSKVAKNSTLKNP
jgi:hypothetical protein